jgi:hypothetical protein
VEVRLTSGVRHKRAGASGSFVRWSTKTYERQMKEPFRSNFAEKRTRTPVPHWGSAFTPFGCGAGTWLVRLPPKPSP